MLHTPRTALNSHLLLLGPATLLWQPCTQPRGTVDLHTAKGKK